MTSINVFSVSETLTVNEIYLSLQGESTFAGLPCVFVRLTGCNLRCSYCDTAYAFTEGGKKTTDEIVAEVRRLAEAFMLDGRPTRTIPVEGVEVALPLVELTGGEPLLQRGTLGLMSRLADQGFCVLVETSGALDLSAVDLRVRRIMDLKCPSSGESHRNHWANLRHLKRTDEVKFVIGTQEDYAWMKEQIATHNLDRVCPVLVSWVHPLSAAQGNASLKAVPAGQTPLSRRELAEAIVRDRLPVRFQAQLHKIVWAPDQRGV